MALNTRLTQNIDLQADGSALTKALSVIETSLNNIIGKAGSLGQALEGGANAGSKAWNNQLKQLNILMGQAQNLQKLLDAMSGQKAQNLLSGLDEQALGKKGAAASRLAQNLTETSSAADVLEKRLATLNKRFADLTLQGRTVGQRDLAKQLNTQGALKDVQALEREFAKLNGQAGSTTGTKAQQENMAKLRQEIIAANAELAKMGQNYRRTDFTDQVNQLRTLTNQYRQAVSLTSKYDLSQPGRAQDAQRTAVGILNQTDAQRLAAIQRASSQFAFPSGISQTTSQQQAENKLADSLNKRLRLLQMIQSAQERGAPTSSVERLNRAYQNLGNTLGEDYKRLQTVNKEVNNTPQAKAAAARQQINETLFGDGGVEFSKRIALASLITTSIFAVMNAAKQAAQFIVDYNAALKQLQAISGSTDTQMQSLATGIGEVGRQSNFSILEITKAATVIAQAGYSASETLQVLQAATTLSTASGSSPTESVDVLTSALGAFQLQAGEANRVVDVLVTALNQSKLSMTQVGQAIQYAGATAKESGVSLDELAAITASLANAGIKSGSTIGTGLRQLLVELQEPTEKFKKSLKDVGLTMADVDVKSLGFVGVVKKLTEAGFGATAAYQSFETRAAAAFLAFQGQVGTYDQLALAISNGGTAAQAQATAMDSLGSQYQRLKNDLGVLVAGLGGPFVDALKVAVSLIADFVEGITDLLAPLAEVNQAMGGWGVVIAGVAAAFAAFLTGNPIIALVAGITALLDAIGLLNKQSDELDTKLANAKGQFDSTNQTVTALDEAIHGLIARQSTLKDGSIALQTETTTLANRFGDLYSYLGKSTAGYNDLLNAMLRYRGEALKQAKIEAQIIKTDAQNSADAAQRDLDSTRFTGQDSVPILRTTDAKIEMGSLINERFRGGVNRKDTNYRDAVQTALGSDDLATVAETRNMVARLASQRGGGLDDVIKALEDRLAAIKKIASLKATIASADQSIQLADAKTTPQAQGEERDLLGLEDMTNRAILSDKGDTKRTRTILSPAIQKANNAIAYIERQLAQTKASTARYAVLTTELSQAKGQLARLMEQQRADEEADAKITPRTARKGTDLTATQVKKDLEGQFPGINAYGEGNRSLAEQTRLYNNYKNGTGPLAAKPGTSYHGNGHALDITPIPGMTLDNIVAYVEGLGLEVVERFNERDPRTGRYHWHVAWKPKTSSFQKKEDTSLKELQSLAATKEVTAAQSGIQALLANARAGIGDSSALPAQLETAFGKYQAASLSAYDKQHPSAGLSGSALKLQQEGRASLIAKLNEEHKKFQADLFKQIADTAEKIYGEATQNIKTQLELDEYKAQAPVRSATRDINRASSKLNRNNVGEGTNYYLQQQKEAAQLNADRATVGLQTDAQLQQGALLGNWQAKVDVMPAGEEKTEQLKKIAAAHLELNKAMQATADLQATINDRTDTYANKLPLNERLKEAAANWANNSGVMNDWSTIMENNVGPALDMLASTLTNVFTKMAEGTLSITGALKTVMSAIAEFIVQLIAKALALMAIKWFLSLIGLQLENSPGGVVVGKKPAGQLTGGEVGKPMKLLGGGDTAGYISQGVFNKDTVPILGARGEYMLRKTAVDSLGIENVDALNRYGAKAMNKMAGAVPVPSNAHQEVNLYVVKPDEKPQLGPKDMVLAITDDMLQGGVTKQLVRKISQGAM